MSQKWSDFLSFLDAMRGKRLLHLGHIHADCDALGSAYAMSRVLPGDIGFARNLKAQAQALSEWLELDWVDSPAPEDYEYTILYDTVSASMLGVPMPDRYAIFDHHEIGGHRFSELTNTLAAGADWGWVKPSESTCSVVIDLFEKHGITIDRKVAIALAAGILTDTGRLQQANAPALKRLAFVLEAADAYVEDVWAVLENHEVRVERRPAVLNALKNVRQRSVNGWDILATETSSHDYALIVVDTIVQLGSDAVIVGFPKWGQAMVIAECSVTMVEQARLNLGSLMKAIAGEVNASDAWGNNAHGRIIAPLPEKELITVCAERIMETLS